MRKTFFLGVLTLCAVIGAVLLGTHSAAAQDPCRDQFGNEICPYFRSWDGRINAADAIATIVGYCRSDYSIQIYGVENSQGFYVFTVTWKQVYDALVLARQRGYVLITEKSERQLFALSSSELQMSAKGYNYRFPGNTCGGFAIPTGNPASAISNPATTPTANPLPADIKAQGTATLNIALNLRTQPSFKASILVVMPRGATVNVIGRTASSQWIYVEYKGKIGWIASYYTTTNLNLARLPVVQ